MSDARLCPYCNAAFTENTQFCQKCGARMTQRAPITTEHSNTETSPKSGKITLVLCAFLGVLGMHRFYVGKIGTGLLTFFTGGFLGIWTLIDLIQIMRNKFQDKKGHHVVFASKLSVGAQLGLIITSIIFWLLITLSSIMAVIAYLTHDLVATAYGQLEALREGDIQKAYSYTSSEYQKTLSLDNFKKWLEEVPELKNNKTVSFDERGINTYLDFFDAGYLEGTLTTNDNKNIRVKYLFIKENNTWKIIGIIPRPN